MISSTESAGVRMQGAAVGGGDPMTRKFRPLMLSGIQPTGALMIGNYVGALIHWVELQATYDSFFLI